MQFPKFLNFLTVKIERWEKWTRISKLFHLKQETLGGRSINTEIRFGTYVSGQSNVCVEQLGRHSLKVSKKSHLFSGGGWSKEAHNSVYIIIECPPL